MGLGWGRGGAWGGDKDGVGWGSWGTALSGNKH